MTLYDPAYGYHDVPPFECPQDQWTRVEVRQGRNLELAVRKLTAAMRALQYPQKDLFAVELVLWEAVNNGLKHGHLGDSRLVVVVCYRVSLTDVFLEITDEGPGFDPYLVPDPLAKHNIGRTSGRGLFLMRVYATWLRFNRRGNRVTLCKRRSPS